MAAVKSARGEMVNFEILRIREQIASTPKPTVVQAREDFIDRKFNRRLKRLTTDVSDAASDSSSAESDIAA